MKSNLFLRLREELWRYPFFFTTLIEKYHKFLLLPLLFLTFAANYIVVDRYLPKSKFAPNSDQLIEGVVGDFTNSYPINPTTNQVDRDIYAMVFDKLFIVDQQGNVYSDIFETFHKDDDLHFSFQLKDGLKWHDNEPVTVDDVIYTIQMHQDLKIDTNVVDARTIQITLPQKNPAIYELLSIYLIPKHIHSTTPPDLLSIKPLVGTGDYKIAQWDADGRKIRLQPISTDFTEHSLAYYPSKQSLLIAYANGIIDYVSTYDEDAQFVDQVTNSDNKPVNQCVSNFQLTTREKTIFINQQRITNSNIRQALQYFIDRDSLIKNAKINAIPIDSVYPDWSPAHSKKAPVYSFDIDKGKELLKDEGLTQDVGGFFMQKGSSEILTFTIVYLSNEINDRIVDELARQYEDAGILLRKVPTDSKSFVNEYIATRNYDLLLLEVEVSADYDRYGLWHSDNMGYPHSNFAQYSYSRVDILLANARQEYDEKKRLEYYQRFHKYLAQDSAAIYLYNPVISTIRPCRADETGNVTSQHLGKQEKIMYPEDRYVFLWRVNH